MPKRNGHGIDLLADPTRRRIVALLALGHRQPSKLAAEIGLSRPATSRQLRLLHAAGLISLRRHYLDRRRVVYFIEPQRLGQIAAWLAGTEVGRAFAQAPATDPHLGARPPIATTVPLERNDPETPAGGGTEAVHWDRRRLNSAP